MRTKAAKAKNKVKAIHSLAETLESDRAEGKTVVHCHGVFDLLHIGHIRHFEQAREMGDILVVTATPDRYVNKGPGRPVFSEDLRAEAIAALDSVDYVAINEWPTATETIGLLRPNYYVKGADYQKADDDRSGGILLEEAAVRSAGGQIVFTDDITFSSSNLINRHLPVFNGEVRDYLEDFRSKYSSEGVLSYLEGAGSLKVLVVGEAIIDEYVYCETLGKSGKEPVLAARHLDSEKFAGGILAVANHVSAFSGSTDLLTFLGKSDAQEDFIREKVDAKINNLFLYMNGDSSTIVKRRYVESYPFQKLFELYVMNDDDFKPEETAALTNKLLEILPNYDVVIVVDYGHGMIGPEAVEIMTSHARCLAINTQANAGNRGFNTVSKYPRADFICVSENEIRLEARSRGRDLRDIVQEVAERMDCQRVIITKGKTGCLCYSRSEGFFEVPALALSVVDRIGAGDAVFAVTALCAAQGAPIEITGVIGNAVGAQAVATVGNRDSIQSLPLFRHIESLLK